MQATDQVKMAQNGRTLPSLASPSGNAGAASILSNSGIYNSNEGPAHDWEEEKRINTGKDHSFYDDGTMTFFW